MSSLFDGPAGLAQLLPHRGPALLLTGVVTHDQTSIEATGCIPADYPLAERGYAPAFVGIEMGAQAAAALEAILRQVGGITSTPKRGHLVRVREATFESPELPVDRPLRVSARMQGIAPPLAIYEVRVGFEGRDYLFAILSTHCDAA